VQGPLVTGPLHTTLMDATSPRSSHTQGAARECKGINGPLPPPFLLSYAGPLPPAVTRTD
jgi:hypothetical protein